MLDEKLQNLLIEMTKTNPYMQHLGIEILSLSEGCATARIPYREDLFNPYSSLHGGVLFSLADITSGIAACTRGSYVSTIHGDMDYLLPAMNTAYVTCKATALRHGRTIAVYRTDLYSDDGTLLETGTFRFQIMNRTIL